MDRTLRNALIGIPRKLLPSKGEIDVNNKLHSLGLGALGLAAIGSWPAHAQTTPATGAVSTDVEEVIVTAEHRSADLQKLGLSITAIRGEDLEQHGDTDLNAVLQEVPGVVMQGVTGGPSAQSVQGGGGPPNIAIRGLGTPTPNTTGAVAVYEDGILLDGGGLNFFDMNRVEVLRGPQGTLYGRGATAGAVNLITNDPTQEFGASGRVEFGNYGLVGTQGMLNMPLADDLAVRVAFNEIHHNGYFNNGMSNEDDFSTRLKLLYKPIENFSILLGYTDYQSNGTGPGQVYVGGTATTAYIANRPVAAGPPPIATNPDGTTAAGVTALQLNANPNPSSWSSPLPGGGFNPIAYRKAYADLEWDFGAAKLTYLGGYQTSNSQFGTNCVCFAPGPNAVNLSYQYVVEPYDQTWTHEVRLASEGNSALSWQVGAYYFSNKLYTSYDPGFNAAIDGVPYQPFFMVKQWFSPESTGFFGEATYALNSSTRLTAGVRDTLDHVVQAQEFPGAQIPNDFDEHLTHFDWKARVETDLSEQNLLYATISTGYRPGAFVNGTAGADEKVTAYEIGSKNRMAGGITLNGDIYYLDYSGFQNVSSQVVNGVVVTTLVPIPAKLYGAEVEATLQFDKNDRLTISPALESAKYTASIPATPSPPMSPPNNGFATDGGQIPNAPKFSVSALYAHTFPLASGANLILQGDAHYQTSTITDFDASNYPAENPTFVQRAYTIWNSSLRFESMGGKYNVSVYGKNLGNTLVKLTVYNATPPFAYDSDPLTFGVMLSAKL
jgi:iron complex outermembrane receptor protein